jgi:hypothetical protein
LQQQLEALKAAQDKTTESLQKSLQFGQTSLNENLQSSQKVRNHFSSAKPVLMKTYNQARRF